MAKVTKNWQLLLPPIWQKELLFKEFPWPVSNWWHNWLHSFFSKWKTTKICIDIVIHYITVQWLLQEIRPRQDSFCAFFLHHSTLWVFSDFTTYQKKFTVEISFDYRSIFYGLILCDAWKAKSQWFLRSEYHTG